MNYIKKCMRIDKKCEYWQFDEDLRIYSYYINGCWPSMLEKVNFFNIGPLVMRIKWEHVDPLIGSLPESWMNRAKIEPFIEEKLKKTCYFFSFQQFKPWTSVCSIHERICWTRGDQLYLRERANKPSSRLLTTDGPMLGGQSREKSRQSPFACFRSF